MNLLVREEGQVGSGGQVGRESGTEYFFAGGGGRMNIAAVLQMGLVLRQGWYNTRIRVSVLKDW